MAVLTNKYGQKIWSGLYRTSRWEGQTKKTWFLYDHHNSRMVVGPQPGAFDFASIKRVFGNPDPALEFLIVEMT